MRGTTLCPRSGVVPRRSYSTPKVGAAAEKSKPMSKKRWLHGCRRAERTYSM